MTTLYYSSNINARVRASITKMTPDQIAMANERAAHLRAQDAELLRGPRVVGGLVIVPSWCWRPEAVREWKARGGYFVKEYRFQSGVTLPAWLIPLASQALDQITAIYRRYFAQEIAQAEASARARDLDRI